nr:TolC family protein [Deltaproteobacteria bacterium]
MRRSFVALAALLAAAPALAQPLPLATTEVSAWTFRDYLARVSRSNLDLLARRLDVPIAEAQVAVARILPDPTVTAGLGTWEPSGRVMPPATYLSLSWPIELGGRRGARVSSAEAARETARAQLDDAVRSLRADAALAFVEVLHTRQVVVQRRRMLATLDRLVTISEVRHRAGDVGEVAVLQARVEAERFRTEVIGAEGDARAAVLGLRAFTGGDDDGEARGELAIAARTFDLEALTARARSSRADVRAAERAVAQSRSDLALARASRWVDAGLTVGWTHNFDGLGPNASTPATVSATPPFEQFSATLSVPLPFSRLNHGALDAAAARIAQAELSLRAARLRAEVEVRQAHARYEAAVARLARYSETLQADADRVLAAMLYNFQRGGATLLEVLSAQRTVDEVTLGYEEALLGHARTLIELERAVGAWDVDF